MNIGLSFFHIQTTIYMYILFTGGQTTNLKKMMFGVSRLCHWIITPSLASDSYHERLAMNCTYPFLAFFDRPVCRCGPVVFFSTFPFSANSLTISFPDKPLVSSQCSKRGAPDRKGRASTSIYLAWQAWRSDKARNASSWHPVVRTSPEKRNLFIADVW